MQADNDLLRAHESAVHARESKVGLLRCLVADKAKTLGNAELVAHDAGADDAAERAKVVEKIIRADGRVDLLDVEIAEIDEPARAG